MTRVRATPSTACCQATMLLSSASDRCSRRCRSCSSTARALLQQQAQVPQLHCHALLQQQAQVQHALRARAHVTHALPAACLARARRRQTGAGKTFTMAGDAAGAYAHRGIIPRALHHIFRAADLRVSDRLYRLAVSYMEVANEVLYDLLAEQPAASADSLAVLDDAGGTVVRR